MQQRKQTEDHEPVYQSYIYNKIPLLIQKKFLSLLYAKTQNQSTVTCHVTYTN